MMLLVLKVAFAILPLLSDAKNSWERSSKIDEAISWGPHWPTAPQDTINLTNGPFRINHTYFAHEIPIFAYVWGGPGNTEGEEEQNICLRLFLPRNEDTPHIAMHWIIFL